MNTSPCETTARVDRSWSKDFGAFNMLFSLKYNKVCLLWLLGIFWVWQTRDVKYELFQILYELKYTCLHASYMFRCFISKKNGQREEPTANESNKGQWKNEPCRHKIKKNLPHPLMISRWGERTHIQNQVNKSSGKIKDELP